MHKSTFPFINSKLKFIEKSHKYFLDDIEFMSVTTWLSSFDEPFNPYKISEQVSKNPNSEYFGMDPEVIRKLWAKTGPRGTKKHNSIEDWLTGKTDYCDEKNFLINLGITPENSWSEVTLCSEKLLLSGTADIITRIDKDVFKIWDIKTSTKIGRDKLEKFSKQILTYGLLLKHMSDRPIKIIPGDIISIMPTSGISEGVNDGFLDAKIVSIDLSVKSSFRNMVKHRQKNI